MPKPTVTIGIPAYNEEANIGFLIESLLAQKFHGFIFKDIVVFSDGSNDKTVYEVERFNSKKIKVIENKKRRGKAFGQNRIFKISDSDILLILDADILIKDVNFVSKLVDPIIKKRVDLTSVRAVELPQTSFLEKALAISMKIKFSVFEKYKDGNNVYTCRGPARVFSKRLYKKIFFKESIGEDAFSYLYCIKNGYKYSYVKNTCLYYKLPSSLKDHRKQSVRFYQSQKKLYGIFGENFVKSEFHYPINLSILFTLKFSLRYPVYCLFYAFVNLYTRLASILDPDTKGKWEISESSKILKYE